MRSRPDGVPEGALHSIEHHLQVASRYRGKGGDSRNARRYFEDASKMLQAAKAGRDPYAGRTGFVVRAYRSKISTELQPYSVYVPRDYDGSKARGLLDGFSVFESGSDEGAWNVVVSTIYRDARGYEAVKQDFEPIRKGHQEALIEGRGFDDLGTVVDSREMFEHPGNTSC